jgi:hypothetical protein
MSLAFNERRSLKTLTKFESAFQNTVAEEVFVNISLSGHPSEEVLRWLGDKLEGDVPLLGLRFHNVTFAKRPENLLSALLHPNCNIHQMCLERTTQVPFMLQYLQVSQL